MFATGLISRGTQPEPPSAEPTRPARRAPMSLALGVVLGGFVLTAVASVMGVGLWSGYRNTVDLLEQKADILVSAAESQTVQYLGAAENQVGFVAEMIASGETAAGPNEEFTNLLFGALAAAPQIKAILHVDGAHNLVGAERDEWGAQPLFLKAGNDAGIVAAVARASTESGGYWKGLVWREEYQQALLCFEHPVFVDGEFKGVLIALISVRSLSEFISDLDTEFGHNAFVLYGRDAVLAHPTMAFGYPGLTALNPLPRQDTFGDPVLGSMWETSDGGLWDGNGFGGDDGHLVKLGEESYAFLTRELTGFGDTPLLIGTYLRANDVYSELMRFKWAVLMCLVILVVSVVTAGLTGRRIAKPVRRLAEGARRVHALDFANVPHIPGSFFKEINDAANSFNAMLDGLRWFERYVPKTLVNRLMRVQGRGAVVSHEREVTVMFTDIVGFTALSERMSATEVAELLNDHFTLVAACIEAEGGTVDKYVGDSVMAFWGAPERHDDHADRACRAALAIADAVRAHNVGRARQGRPQIRMRIGLHSGPVVVGNIGSPGRINYTVIGDTVNTAKRMDELGRIETGGDDTAPILISGETAKAIHDFDLTPLGRRRIKGKAEALSVFSLTGPGRPAPIRPQPRRRGFWSRAVHARSVPSVASLVGRVTAAGA